MVPEVRIERTSPALQAGAKTTSATQALFGVPGEFRNLDLGIKSPLLCL